MHVHIIAVGKIKERSLRELVDGYYDRIGRYARLKETELKDGSAAEVIERVQRAIPDRSRVVALEVDGESKSSDQLAQVLARCQNDGTQNLVFLIGGAYGLPPEVARKADLLLSLSALTFPHRLVRLMLAEQIYRAFTILRGEPYSH